MSNEEVSLPKPKLGLSLANFTIKASKSRAIFGRPGLRCVLKIHFLQMRSSYLRRKSWVGIFLALYVLWEGGIWGVCGLHIA